MQSRVNRRSVIISGAAIGGMLAPGAGARAQSSAATPDASATPVSGEWTFTDDKGVTVTLPERPTRIVIDVNAAAPLWDFGVRPTALFGWNVLADGSLGDAGGNIDPEGIPTVGNVNEPINVEDALAQDPDLLITLTWTPDDPDDYWSIDPALLPQVQQIAPLVGMSATGNAELNTRRFAELAKALGANTESEEVQEAKASFEDAVARFNGLVSDKGDLSVLFISITEDKAWVANPADWGDLNYFLTAGLNIVQPDAEPGSYWEEISPEMALKYPADIMMASTREEALSLDEIKASPTFGAHPAVMAGHLFGWNQDFIQSYQGMTESLTAVSDALETSNKIDA